MAGKTGKGNNGRLSLRLPAERKETIEKAAAQLGLTVREFAAWTLVQTARKVISGRNTTRHRRRSAAPAARKAAAKKHKRRA